MKSAGLELCEKYHQQYGKDFISVMPTNRYGPNDNYQPSHSHVIPGMMWRFHEAKMTNQPEVVIWGGGTPRREFLFVDDLAEATLVLRDRYTERHTINVGTGQDCSIRELAPLMKEVVGFPGAIGLDPTNPDGTPRKLLDVSRITALGWRPTHHLRDGLADACRSALAVGVFQAG